MNHVITPEHLSQLAFERERKLARIELEHTVKQLESKLREWRKQDEQRAESREGE